MVFSGHRTLESQEQPSSSTFRVANFARWVPKLFNDSNDFGTILWALFISISTLNSNFFPRIHGRLATRSRRSSRQELKINILGYPQRERESKHGTSYINKRSNQLKCVFAKVTIQLTDKSWLSSQYRLLTSDLVMSTSSWIVIYTIINQFNTVVNPGNTNLSNYNIKTAIEGSNRNMELWTQHFRDYFAPTTEVWETIFMLLGWILSQCFEMAAIKNQCLTRILGRITHNTHRFWVLACINLYA